MAEYEHLRGDESSFLTALSEEHLEPEIERIAERTDGYFIVEKLVAAEPAVPGRR